MSSEPENMIKLIAQIGERDGFVMKPHEHHPHRYYFMTAKSRKLLLEQRNIYQAAKDVTSGRIFTLVCDKLINDS